MRLIAYLSLLLVTLAVAVSASWNGVCDTGALNATLVAVGVQTQFYSPSVATDGSKVGVLFVDSSFLLNVSFSTDSGKTFSVPLNVAPFAKGFELHHVGGKWIAVYATATYVASRSSADGVTWDAEAVVTLYGSVATPDTLVSVAAPQLNTVAAFYTIGEFIFAEYIKSDGKWGSFGPCPVYNITNAIDCFGMAPTNVSSNSIMSAAWDGSRFLVVYEQLESGVLAAQAGVPSALMSIVSSSSNLTTFSDDFNTINLFSTGSSGVFMLAGLNTQGNVVAQTTTTLGASWSPTFTVMIGDQLAGEVAGVYTGNEFVLAFSTSLTGVGSGDGAGDVVMTGSQGGEVWYSPQIAVDAGSDVSYELELPTLASTHDGSYMMAWLRSNTDDSDTGLYFAMCSKKSYYSGDSSVVRASLAVSAAAVVLSSLFLSA